MGIGVGVHVEVDGSNVAVGVKVAVGVGLGVMLGVGVKTIVGRRVGLGKLTVANAATSNSGQGLYMSLHCPDSRSGRFTRPELMIITGVCVGVCVTGVGVYVTSVGVMGGAVLVGGALASL